MARRRLLALSALALLVAVTLALLDARPPPRSWSDVHAGDAASLGALVMAVVCARMARLAARAHVPPV